MKKIILYVIGACGLALFAWTTCAQLNNDINPFTDPTDAGTAEQIWLVGTDEWQGDAFANVVRGFINWMLGILALIALIILLWGGFQMVTAAGDEEKYKKWWTILKQWAIWLAVIGVARFLVSLIFRLINLTTTTSAWTDGGTDS